jgi:tRNA modification GTPase
LTERDTIAAIATPPGRGGIGIVRVSGPGVRAVAEGLLGRLPAPRRAVFTAFRDGDGAVIDEGIALYFPAPRSYTGEDVLELHAHGSPVVLDMLLERACALGARPARPGEFTERAFLNGKLDLAQAEAVADLIEAASRAAARAARRSLTGEFSRRVEELIERLTALRTYVEAAIDFPEEEIDFLSQAGVAERLAALRTALAGLETAARQGALLHEGLTVVIAGPPNAGKSSLLNALSGEETAIVSPIPGTTRDVLRAEIDLGEGLRLRVLDTAGLRESTDEIETEGMRRARAAMARADRVLLVLDAATPDPAARAAAEAQLPPTLPRTIIYNKIDLTGEAPALRSATAGPTAAEIRLSAKTGAGLELLRAHLKESAGFRPAGENDFTARRRHLDAIARAACHLEAAAAHAAAQQGELLAEELRLAQDALGEITGKLTSDDLLGRIFSSFCIGK